MKISQRPGSRSLQSASLPGRPPESSAPLRRVRSRALRAASRARRLDRLGDDALGHRRVVLEVIAQLLVDQRLDLALDVAVELALGLALELGLGQLDADHGDQALAHVVASEVFLDVLEQVEALADDVDGAGEGAAEAGEVGAAVDGVDVVGEAEQGLGVAVVVLQRHLHLQHAAGDLARALHQDGFVVQHLLAAVEVADKLGDAAAVAELGGLVSALVAQGDEQAAVEEAELAQAVGEGVEVVLGGGEDPGVGFEGDLGAALLGLAGALDGPQDLAAGEGLLPGVAFAPDLVLERLRERVDVAHAHPVQAAGDLVAGAVELAAGVQLGHHDLGGAAHLPVHLHLAHRDAAAVVHHGDRVVGVDGDVDAVGEAGQGLVDGVVHHLVDEMVQAHLAGGADVHGGALAHRLHPAQDLDRGGGIIGVVGGRRAYGNRVFGAHEGSSAGPRLAPRAYN